MFLCLKPVTYFIISALSFGHSVYRNNVFMLEFCDRFHYFCNILLPLHRNVIPVYSMGFPEHKTTTKVIIIPADKQYSYIQYLFFYNFVTSL